MPVAHSFGLKATADAKTAHYSASLCHLANIGVRVGRSFQFDPSNESILRDEEANALLGRTYREGHWAAPKGVWIFHNKLSDRTGNRPQALIELGPVPQFVLACLVAELAWAASNCGTNVQTSSGESTKEFTLIPKPHM